MIDARQHLITLSAACRGPIQDLLGRRIAPATAYRWVRTGILAGDGTRVRLAAIKIGRSYMTTPGAVNELLESLTQRAGTTPPNGIMRGAQIDAQLKAAGRKSLDSVDQTITKGELQ